MTANPTPTGAAEENPSEAKSIRTTHILVVDDEPDLKPLIERRMRPDIRSGRYKFLFAQDGKEAVDILLEKKEVHMVVTDINMPRMDGLTLLGKIQEIDPNIRSIIVSAYGDMKNIRTAMNRGAFDFVVKPLDFEDFRITLERTANYMEEWREAQESKSKLRNLQNELETASEMQQSILPIEFPLDPRFTIHGTMEPARNIGGDFFDIFRLRHDNIGIAVADVSDKGIPAALFMMASRTLLKGAAIGMDQPADVLTEVNRALQEDNRRTMFVTMIYAAYNPDSGEMTYANGGHCNPLLVAAGGDCRELDNTNGVVLGLAPGLIYDQKNDRMQPGDTLILYSDGVTEARNQDDDEFGEERLMDLFRQNPPEDAGEACTRIRDAIREFARGMPQADDITCLALRRTA